MCGLFGVVGEGAESVASDAALAALAHRGPDGHGSFSAPGVTLAHTRLAIIDLSPSGAQPMHHGATSLVFNGEIYNHKALQATLQARGAVFRSRSDSEAILHAYAAYGPACVSALDGMFAFALWDAHTRTLLLARDRSGKKPLFYAQHAGRLYFASQARALGVPLVVDPNALSALLVLGYVPAPHTIHAGVTQLEPGTSAVWKDGALRTQGYWHNPFASPQPARADARAQTRQLLTAAVSRRLESDVPLGAFLSGGIDSTIVVGLMQRLLGQRVKTFSIGFSGDARYDETAYARIAARAFDTDHTEFQVTADAVSLLDALVKHHDGPFGDSSAIPMWIVSALTKQHVSVALTGDGGDELFAGYTRFYAAAAAEALPRALALLLHSAAARLPVGAHSKSLYTRGIRFARRATLPLGERLVAWSGYFVDDLDAVLRPEVATDRRVAWRYGDEHTPREGSPMQRALAHNFDTYLPNDLLVKADRSAMAHGLELRSPFLDTALIDFAAGLTSADRRRGMTTKWILRQAFADLLPERIRTRGKMGFGVPLGAWFRGPLLPLLRQRLHAGARCMQWLDAAYVGALIDAHVEGKVDNGHKLWLLLTLESWLWQR